MALVIMGTAIDARTGTHVIYAKADIPTYLEIVGSEFDEFDIQRKRVQHKAYARMKDDIKSGTLLPSITLAVKDHIIDQAISSGQIKQDIASVLTQPGALNILDGLQRTHTLKDIAESGHTFKPEQSILLEIWLEPNIRNLIYRIIVLNAGQKPMSMRHQMELLFYSTKATLERKIPGLEIFTERDESRRTRAKKYPLDRISLAYYAFISKAHEVNKDNIVAQQLTEDSILAQGLESFGESFDRFAEIFERLTQVDQLAESRYSKASLAWIGSENFLLGFFAAAANACSRQNGDSLVDGSLARLIDRLHDKDEVDPLGIENYQKVAAGIDSRRTNVGYGTRKLIFNGFREFFRSQGEDSFDEIWPRESD